ncbi:MAG: UDP-glucose/GDP-mannose dehydrogenase family protein [Nitrospirae bacterium]|jgi:UDPglucose 6-dehydrogenase|nr:UDP-glucose/GDP-mannose dehydrogenase family protein [Nitrospirota bacterium]
MHIGIIGTGYVGLVTGACFAEFGVFVTCVDKDQDKIKSLRKGIIPFYEPGLDELVKRNIQQGRLEFTTKIAKAVESSLVIFIAVGTPRRGDGSADMKYVEEVAREIAKYMDGYKVIVTKSTVPVGTGEKLREIISGNLKDKIDFDIVSNPEFLREGSAIEDLIRPNRVVIGANSPQAVAIMKDLYKPLYLIETPFVVTNIETAELIKYASNSFLAIKISFINEMAKLCEKVGADVHMVAKGMGLDQRIGPKFLHPGPGYGGSCLPKDTNALLKMAEEHGIRLNIVDAAIRVNEDQKRFMVKKIKDAMGVIKGKTIALLGLSFKPNTDDIREAPSLDIIMALLKEGVNIRTYDPIVNKELIAKSKGLIVKNSMLSLLSSRLITFCKDAYDAAKGANALVLVTEWNQFRNLELDRIKELLKDPYFFDLRNVYEPQKMRAKGFKYYSVGRI